MNIMLSRRSIVNGVTMVTLAAAGLLGVSASAGAKEAIKGAAQAGDAGISPSGPSSVVARPWTKEAMLAAKPYPLKQLASSSVPAPAPQLQPSGPPVVGGGSVAGQTGGVTTEPDPVEVVGPGAGGTSAQPAGGTSAQPAGGTGAQPATMPYPFSFSRYYVATGLPGGNAYKLGTYAKVGKLFFNQLGGSYSCSAAVMDNRGLLTAGHCLHAGNNNENGWSTNVVFVPAYKDGAAPYGQWPCEYVTQRVFVDWFANGDNPQFRRDVGGCKLSLVNGQKLSSIVGSNGWAYNLGAEQHYHAMGYPAEPPFDGGDQIVCAAQHATWDAAFSPPSAQGIGCDMNRGASGGPWFRPFKPSGISYVNGVNSYKYFGTQPRAMYSPYFDQAVYDSIIAVITAN